MLERLETVAEKTARQTDLRPEIASINVALGQVAELAARIRTTIVSNRRAATAHLYYTLIAVVAFTTLIMCIGVWIGVAQYRSVMHPLRRLEMAVRRAAAADFTSQVPVEGDREFAQLAAQFNRMADQLGALYCDLESQVAIRSRQLVQSERLASVGYLAAGLAHEINNPLGIICGYAEAALARLDQSAEAHDAQTMALAGKALRIICEEAFRCRDITSQLLSLARPGRQDAARREPVNLVPVARRVVDMLAGLPQFKQNTLKLHTAGAPLIAEACEAEVVQVLINLVANALEAVDSGAGGPGRVDVKLRRDDDWIVVEVVDNGRGMSPEIAARVFEPFFTDKPRRDLRGTGLGLSVAHAIVDQHGGRLRAASAGEGRGSTFTLQLPVAMEVASHA
jgi:signal transduction histidine kinase